MEKFWLNKAHKYIQEHNAFSGVSKINFLDTSDIDNAEITAIVSIGLPSKFIKTGKTAVGVKNLEEVRFIFPKRFPLEAPKLLLRDDFPRCFPHINPSENHVNPCIFEGSLSELLQQSEWMNAILNQLVDWLEKAASDDLLNYEQGWEPMRNDHRAGFMLYDLKDTIENYKNRSVHVIEIDYENRNKIIVTGSLCDVRKSKKAFAVFCITPRVVDSYLPNSITNLSELYKYAESIGITSLKKNIEIIDYKSLHQSYLFVVLSVKRPCKLIGSDLDIEFLNFVVIKSKLRKKKKRVLPDCNVKMLSHISDKSPALLRTLSGTNAKVDEKKSITLLGCGSLGSKIGMHLARNGNGQFLCVDNDIFLPHNNARHALTLTWAQNKAELLALSMFCTSGLYSKPINDTAFNIDYGSSRLIIDTTASLSVKTFLMSASDLPPIISGNLYGKGRLGVLFLENSSQKTKLCDLWAYLYYLSLTINLIRHMLFSQQMRQIQIGQSCGSQTLVVDDARISLMAANMSLRVQEVLENGLPEAGELMLSEYDDNYSLRTELIKVPNSIIVPSVKDRDWQVRLSETIKDEMEKLSKQKSPNETGGVLLGTVFLNSKTIVVTGLLPAPTDSLETPCLFVLGTEDLESKIKSIEKKTNGKVTYLGTWHSHPHGGSASQTDERTYKRLLFVRNYEPTVCLILTPECVFQV